MAIDMFLKIGGIDGESIDTAHAGEIDVLAYSLGFSNSGDVRAGTGTGAGAGKASAQDLSLTVYNSKASLPLFLAVATGKIFANATLTLRKGGTNPFEFLKIRLENVLVSSDSSGGSGGEDRLTENYSLNYARIIFTYTGQDATGVALPPIRAGFDFSTNTKI
jgi:type VI secretion system secreted protein Hcp